MKRILSFAALSVLILGSSPAFSQSRDLGSRRLVLDDGGTGRLTIEYAGPGAGTLLFPNGGGAIPSSGSATNSTLRWSGTSWVENTSLTADASGNVGAGIATPLSRMHIHQTNAGLGGALTISNYQGFAGAQVGINLMTYDAAGQDPNARILVTDDGSYGSTFQFQTKVDGANTNSLATRLTIGNTGNLTVQGAVSATSLTLSSDLSGAGANRFAQKITVTGDGATQIFPISNTNITASSVIVVSTVKGSAGNVYSDIIESQGPGTFSVRLTPAVAVGETVQINYIVIN